MRGGEYSSARLEDLSPEERDELTKRIARRMRRENEDARPMSPDQDFSWENTDFKDYEND
jgi:hypothetical protein